MVAGEESNQCSNLDKNPSEVECSDVETSVISLRDKKISDAKENGETYERNSNSTDESHKDSWCRICQEVKSDALISPCKCRGTQGLIHLSCLEHWLQVSGLVACEVCFTPYVIHSVPMHSPFVSICIWIFRGGNKKFMVCDLILISLLTLMMYWMLKNVWTIKRGDSFDYYPAGISFLTTCLFAITYFMFIYATFRFYFKKWLHWHNTRNSVRVISQDYAEMI